MYVLFFFFSPVIKVDAEPTPKSLSMKSSPVIGTTMGKSPSRYWEQLQCFLADSWSKWLTLTSNKVTRVWRAVTVTPKFKQT
ncbi:hypothetical protein ACOSQ3_017515 [Xanthoceras sorbifolium]